jgi:hypothetical protein
MTRVDVTAILETAVSALKWRDMACNKLVKVRRIDENDEETLARVVDDYHAIKEILREYAAYEEQRRLGDLFPGALPTMLKTIFQRMRDRSP